MPEHLYAAHPSLFRMRPFGTLVVIVLLILGGLVAFLGKGLLPEEFAAPIAGMDDQIVRIVGIAVFALSLLQLFSWWLATLSDRVAITEDEVLWTHGLLSKQYTEIGMGSVRTVRVKQSLLQRMLGAGDVYVFTSGDIPELVVKGLPDPNRIRELVKARSSAEA